MASWAGTPWDCSALETKDRSVSTGTGAEAGLASLLLIVTAHGLLLPEHNASLSPGHKSVQGKPEQTEIEN